MNIFGFIVLCLVLPVAWGLLVHVLFGLLRGPGAHSVAKNDPLDYQI